MTAGYRIKESTKEKLHQCLEQYVRDHSEINREGKFRCFNSQAHQHNDRSFSAGVVPGSQGKAWNCFVCGAKGDIFSAVNYKEGIKGFLQQAQYIAEKYGIPVEYENDIRQGIKENNIAKKLVKTYYYQNETGINIFKVERWEWGEEGVYKKEFLPYRSQQGKWIPGIKGVKRPLYKLLDVIAAVEEKKEIFIVEGEKCVEKAEELGITATTTFGGARGWKSHAQEYIPFLKGAKVVILPDADAPGKRYAEDIARDLKEVGESIKILELPGLKEKEDIVEWIEKGGTAEALKKLVGECPLWIPSSEKPNGEEELFTKENLEEIRSESAEEEVLEGGFGTVYEKNSAYYKNTKYGEKAISNFCIHPLFMIEGESRKEIKVAIEKVQGGSIHKVLDLNDFNDVNDFRASLNELDLSYAGNVEELQYIKNLLSKKDFDRKKGVDYMGFHKIEEEWFFVSGDTSINSNLQTVDTITMLKDCEELTSEILNIEPISKEELKSIAGALFNFNALPITSTTLGYTAGLYLKGKLAEEKIKYNHLLIEGQSGSGKSQSLENVIMPLLCIFQSAINAGEGTPFALNRAASSSNFVPLILDEYKPDKIGQYKVNLISSIMRNAYDSHRGMRGVRSLKKNMEFNSKTSVILSGEVGITETANIERSLKLFFSKSTHTEQRRKALELLKENKNLLHKLGRSFLNIAIKKDTKRLAELHKALCLRVIGRRFRDERVKRSIANGIMGLVLIKEVFEELGCDLKECTGYKISELVIALREGAFEDLMEKGTGSKSALFQCLETMNRMAAKGDLMKGYDFDSCIDGEGDIVLRLNYTCFYDSFVKYCNDHRVDHEILPLSTFKRQLKKAEYCKSYNKTTKFKKKGSYNETQTYRAAVLYVKFLEEQGLELESLLSQEIV